MKTLRSIIFSILPLAFFCVAYAADNDHKIEYRNVQRKGANYFNQILSEDWFVAAKEAGIQFARLATDKHKTDYAIFLFDNGDKNMISAMLNYAREEDASVLDHLNFRIIFMGPSTDAMSKAPFCHYSEKLIHYKQLGVEETVDHTWKRDRKLSQTSIERLSQSLNIQKKIWIGVSCSIFEQILYHYQENTNIEVVALRDNPNPDGATDYFPVADEIQSIAKKVAIPSEAASEKLHPVDQEIVVIGHGPMEEWCREVESIDRKGVLERLGLNSQLPIIVYAGAYGDDYENAFKMFLELIPDGNIQILVVPHPRYEGVVEKKICENLKYNATQLMIIGEFETDPTKTAKTVEALSIADAIVTADATSTIVFQGNALKKNVLYVNSLSSPVIEGLCAKKLIQKITTPDEFLKLVGNIELSKETMQSSDEDVFQLLGIPRNGAKLLWEELLH